MGARVCVEDMDFSMFSIVGGSAADTQVLHDGIPGTQCHFIWPAGAQTTSTTVLIPFAVSINDGPVPTDLQLFGLENVSGLPVGLKVELVSGAGPTPGTVRATGTLRRLPTGRIGVWFLLDDDEAFDDTSVGFLLYNDVEGATAVLASAEYDVGEVWASPVRDWPVSDITIRPKDPSVTNRSANNQPFRIALEPYREVVFNIVPQRFADAFTAMQNLQADMFALSRLKAFAICVRPERRGGAIDQDYVNATSLIVSLDDMSELRSNAATDRWPMQVTASENN